MYFYCVFVCKVTDIYVISIDLNVSKISWGDMWHSLTRTFSVFQNHNDTFVKTGMPKDFNEVVGVQTDLVRNSWRPDFLVFFPTDTIPIST